MAKKNIGATISLKDGGFRAGIRNAIMGTNQFKSHTVSATGMLKRMGIQGNSTGNSLTSFAKKITGVAAAYVGLSKIKDALEFGDTLVQNDARLNLMNDGLQTTAQLNDKIFQSALRARGGYMETSQAIAKMGILAGGAFKNNDEIISFTEIMNKAFKVGGSSAEEQKNATYQLTQAMAAGKLQGDEFRSIMENAPMLADAISKQMKIPKGQLKEMSSSGMITADIIKNSMFTASEQINKQFDTMPITFGDRMEKWKNIGIQRVKPFMTYINNTVLPVIESSIVKGVNTIKPYIDSLKPVFKGVWDFGVSAFNNIKGAVEKNMPKFATLKGVLLDIKDKLYNAFENARPTLDWLKDTALPLVVDAIGNVVQKATDLYNYVNNNWTQIKPIVDGITSAIAAYYTALIITETWTKLVAFATGLWTGAVNLWKFAAMGGLGVEMAWVIWRGQDLLITGILTGMYAWDAIVKGIHTAATWLQVGATTALTGAQWLLNAAFIASPIGWIVLGIGLLVGAFILLWKKCDPFREFWINLWGKIVEGVQGAVDKIKELWGQLKEFLKNPIQGVVKLFKKTDEDADGGGTTIDGSHANGLPRVPFNGYIARLHKNERVLTAQENKQYSDDNSKTINLGGIYITVTGATSDEIIDDVVPKLQLAIANL